MQERELGTTAGDEDPHEHCHDALKKLAMKIRGEEFSLIKPEKDINDSDYLPLNSFFAWNI